MDLTNPNLAQLEGQAKPKLQKLTLCHFPCYVVNDSTLAQFILSDGDLFSAYPINAVPPSTNLKLNRMVLSLLDGELHKTIKSKLLDLLRSAWPNVERKIVETIDQASLKYQGSRIRFEFTKSEFGLLGPIAVCEFIGVHSQDQYQLARLFYDICINNQEFSEFNSYLSLLWQYQHQRQEGVLFDLFNELLDMGYISFNDIIYNVSLLFEASISTVTTLLVHELRQNSNDKLEFVAETANPIKNIGRQCSRQTVVDGITMPKGSVLLISLELLGAKHVYGYGPHVCPGKKLAKLIVDKFRQAIDQNYHFMRVISCEHKTCSVSTTYRSVIVEANSKI